MNPSFVFELTLDPAETVRASQEVEKRARTLRGQALLMAIFALPLALGMILKVPLSTFKVYFVVLLAILVVALIWPAIRERQVRRLYSTTPAFRGPQRYEFSDDGLSLSNDGISNRIRWSALTEAAETSEFFLLYYSAKCAYYLPKRLMESESQADALRTLLRDKLGPKAKLVASPT